MSLFVDFQDLFFAFNLDILLSWHCLLYCQFFHQEVQCRCALVFTSWVIQIIKPQTNVYKYAQLIIWCASPSYFIYIRVVLSQFSFVLDYGLEVRELVTNLRRRKQRKNYENLSNLFKKLLHVNVSNNYCTHSTNASIERIVRYTCTCSSFSTLGHQYNSRLLRNFWLMGKYKNWKITQHKIKTLIYLFIIQSIARARHMSTIDLPVLGPLIGVTEPRWQQKKRVFSLFKNRFHLFKDHHKSLKHAHYQR